MGTDQLIGLMVCILRGRDSNLDFYLAMPKQFAVS